jgi:hypothetical protein
MNEEELYPRVLITPRAEALLRGLKERYGPLLFHQSGGCCDGSVPFCLRQMDFRIGARDVLLDVIEGTPFYVGELLFPNLCKEQLLLDVVPFEGGDSFSLEATDGMRFVTHEISTRVAPELEFFR